MLKEHASSLLANCLLPRERWHPFADAGERNFWNGLPPTVREAHINRGEERLDYAWPPLPASLFLEFARDGNCDRYQRRHFARREALCDLVLAECMEGEGRFVDDIVNGLWAVCEESFWGVPAHVGMQKAGYGLPDVEEPVVPLFVGETAGLLAWTLYLLGPQLDEVSPLIRRRLHLEMDRRVLSPCLERDDFSWMGFPKRACNNWNPWVNSNWLTAVLLMERDAARRVAAIAKIMRSLDNFIDHYPADGGCDEGPVYWGRAGASLFDCLELLYSSTDGAVDMYGEPLIRNMGRFICKSHIAGRYFLNFADAAAWFLPPDDVVFRYGRRIHDSAMTAFGAWAARKKGITEHGFTGNRQASLGRRLAALPLLRDLGAAEAVEPLIRDVWLPDIQVMTARDTEGSANGLYLAAKGGHNKESHNHNDVGHFIVYVDGRPLVVDVGVETYTRRTFSPDRYEIWTMQSAFHNLPTVNGAMQCAGREFAARDVEYAADDTAARLVLDMAAAYPPEAGINMWKRCIELRRQWYVELTDIFKLQQPADALTLSLMTPCEVSLNESGICMLRRTPLGAERFSGAGRIMFEPDKFSATVETITLRDDMLKAVWGDCLRRILLTARQPKDNGAWKLRITT